MWKKWKKTLVVLTLLILGLGLFVFVVRKGGGIGKALQAVAAIGWTGVALFVLNASGTLVFPAMGWWILMRGDGLKVSLGTTLKANFMGFPINFVAPSMYLGAEPLKTFYVSHQTGDPKRRVLATIIVSKFQEVGALLFTMIGACGVALWKLRFTREQEILLASSMGILLVLFILGVYAFVGNFQPTVKVINFVARILGKRARRRMARLRTRAEEMEHLIHAAFTKRGKTFLAAQVVTLGSSVSILFRPWIYFAFSQDHLFLGMEYLCAIYLVTNLVNMLPHTPGGLGIMETVMSMLFALTKMGAEHAIAYQLCSRLADLALILLGGWLIFHYNLQAIARRVAKGEEQVSVRDVEGPESNGAGPTPP
jgi:uncharacterized protein (TIRG00374 family)